MGLEAGIWASSLGFGPRDWNLGLKTGIWASRLEFGPQGWTLRGGMKEEEEKIPHIRESICHRPLWGRCPKRGPTNQPTNPLAEGPTYQGEESCCM